MTTLTVTAQGGSLWSAGGEDIFADRRPDGSVYVRAASQEGDERRCAREEVDPSDTESWDVDGDAFADSLRAYFDLDHSVRIELR